MAEIGNRQGDPISPLLFISLLERAMEATKCNRTPSGINVHGTMIKDLRFADDVNLMQTLVDQLYTSSKNFGLQVNCNKSKVMVFERRPTHHPAITVDSDILECVSEFTYVGNLITTNNDCSAEIARRITLSSQRMGMLKTLWRSSELSTKTKIDVLVSCVFSRLLYCHVLLILLTKCYIGRVPIVT